VRGGASAPLNRKPSPKPGPHTRQQGEVAMTEKKRDHPIDEDRTAYEAACDALVGATSAEIARFALQWFPNLVRRIREQGGPDLDAVDMDDEVMANNCGAMVAMMRFSTVALGAVTGPECWTREMGPHGRGPQSFADRALMSHAPMLLLALRETTLILGRVLATGDTDVNMPEELSEVLCMVSEMSGIVSTADERDQADDVNVSKLADLVIQAAEAAGLFDGSEKDGGAGIVPDNPFGPPTEA